MRHCNNVPAIPEGKTRHQNTHMNDRKQKQKTNTDFSLRTHNILQGLTSVTNLDDTLVQALSILLVDTASAAAFSAITMAPAPSVSSVTLPSFALPCTTVCLREYSRMTSDMIVRVSAHKRSISEKILLRISPTTANGVETVLFLRLSGHRSSVE